MEEDVKLDINGNILHALSSIPKFRHSARSIESITSMSRISNMNSACFEEKHLLPKMQLQLRDVNEFNMYLNKGFTEYKRTSNRCIQDLYVSLNTRDVSNAPADATEIEISKVRFQNAKTDAEGPLRGRYKGWCYRRRTTRNRVDSFFSIDF